MNIVESIKSLFVQTQPQQDLKSAVKQLTFPITGVQEWQDYSYLLESDNYLEQYFGWTFKAIDTVAKSVVNYPVRLAKGNEDDYELIPKQENQLLKDLYAFNPIMSLYQARKLTKIHIRLTGMAFWLITESEDIKSHKYEFYILDPTRMSVKTGEFGLPIGYYFQDKSGQRHFIDIKNLIVFKDTDPRDWTRGRGILQASRLSHNGYELAMRYNMNVFGNMGRPNGFLAFAGVNKTEKDKIERKLQQKYRGIDNAGKNIGVLNVKPEWIPISESPRDLEFSKGIETMRDEILSMHGVPKPLVGLTDSTYTNSTEAQRVFQQYTLLPELLDEADVLTEQLLPKYYIGQPSVYSDLFFIADDPVEMDVEKTATSSSMLWNSGGITLNEYRKANGYETVKGSEGDQYKQTNTSILDIPTDPNADPSKQYVNSLEKKLTLLTAKVNAIPESKKLENEAREELKKYFFNKSIRRENLFVEVAKQYFAEQADRMVDKLKEKKAIDLTFDYGLEDEIEIAVTFFTDIFAKVSRLANRTANKMTGQTISISDDTKAKIKKKLQYFASEINKTTRDDMVRLIASAVESGETAGSTKSKIKDLFDRYINGGEGITMTRSEMIARTEVGGITNMVSRANYVDSDVVSGLEWLTAHDNDVRSYNAGDAFDHVSADGQVVQKGVKFKVSGEPLEYPGDPNGSAGNVINCRCTLIPVIKGLEKYWNYQGLLCKISASVTIK